MQGLTETITVESLIAAHQDTLQLIWHAGQEGKNKIIEQEREEYAGLVGYLNLIHPHQIPVLGVHEFSYLAKLELGAYSEAIEALFATYPSLIVITDEQQPSPEMIACAKTLHIPLIAAKTSGQDVIDHFSHYLTQKLASRTIVHGVFMEVLDLGVLLSGASGMGKSELALELINRGHRLVADDSPIFARFAPDILTGSCPPILQDFLEVRGLGIINVRKMFGDTAVKDKKQLHLIVNVIDISDEQMHSIDRLQGLHKSRELLQVSVPEVTLPAGPGRSLSILVEAAVRNQVLKQGGYHANVDFDTRHRLLLEELITQPASISA